MSQIIRHLEPNHLQTSHNNYGIMIFFEIGEKVTLEITILMSLTFFMNVVSDMQPPSSETPLIGTYFSCIMIMVASSVVCTILVLNYHHRLASEESMPPWFRTLFLQWIPWLIRMSRPGNKITRRSIYLQNKVCIYNLSRFVYSRLSGLVQTSKKFTFEIWYYPFYFI